MSTPVEEDFDQITNAATTARSRVQSNVQPKTIMDLFKVSPDPEVLEAERREARAAASRAEAKTAAWIGGVFLVLLSVTLAIPPVLIWLWTTLT